MKTLRLRYPKLSTRNIALLGVLSALQLVLSRFTLGTNFLKVGFTFIIIILIAKWFGPIIGILSALINDYLGTIINGTTFFIGFTLSAVITMLIYSLFFYNKPHITFKRVLLATFLVVLIVDLLMNTMWVSIMFNYDGEALKKLFEIRAIKEFIILFIQVPISYLILNNSQLNKINQKIN